MSQHKSVIDPEVRAKNREQYEAQKEIQAPQWRMVKEMGWGREYRRKFFATHVQGKGEPIK